MKRILIVTQYIYPEPFKSSEMAFELVKRGYKVDVLTGIPNYPEGHYYKGYGLFRKRKEVKEGVTFYRCLLTPRKLLPEFIGISLNYLTFAFNATLWVFFFFMWKKKYDAIITHEPSPITQIIPACILGDIKHIPVYSWIQDIWPDSVESSLKGKHETITKILGKITDWVYRHSTKLLITSKGMADLINRNADYSDKIIYFPQWAEDSFTEPSGQINHCDKYNIMMVGSLNNAIGIPDLMALCKELKDDPVRLTFVGGGSEEQTMRKIASDNNLDNVCFTGRQPFSEMPSYYAQADAMLLTLKPTYLPHLKVTIPARLQGYLSAGKPVLAMIDGNSAEVIRDADCGHVVPAGEYKELAEYIRNVVLTDKDSFSKKGENARQYFLANFTKQMCIDNLVAIIDTK